MPKHDDLVPPSLEDMIAQLKAIGGDRGGTLARAEALRAEERDLLARAETLKRMAATQDAIAQEIELRHEDGRNA